METLKEGTTVRLVGLKSRPELNDQKAIIVSYDPERKRYSVRLLKGSKKAKAEIKGCRNKTIILADINEITWGWGSLD